MTTPLCHTDVSADALFSIVARQLSTGMSENDRRYDLWSTYEDRIPDAAGIVYAHRAMKKLEDSDISHAFTTAFELGVRLAAIAMSRPLADTSAAMLSTIESAIQD